MATTSEQSSTSLCKFGNQIEVPRELQIIIEQAKILIHSDS